MPIVAIVLVLAVVISTVVLVGLIWALLVLIPFYAYVGVAVYLVWKASRKYAEAEDAVRREAQRQRYFNEQEMRAWRAVIEQDQRNQAKRERVLNRFDRPQESPQDTRNPPTSAPRQH